MQCVRIPLQIGADFDGFRHAARRLIAGKLPPDAVEWNAGTESTLFGEAIGGEDTAPPFGVSWNTTLGANGSHALTAVARDAAGHATVSAPVVVTVDNPASPPIGLVAYLKLDDGKGTTVLAESRYRTSISIIGWRPKLNRWHAD